MRSVRLLDTASARCAPLPANVRKKLTIVIKKPVIKSLPPHTFTCPTCDGSAKLTTKKLISRIAPNAVDTSPYPNRTRLLFESVTGLV